MFRCKLKVNVVLLATMAISFSTLAVTAASKGELPPQDLVMFSDRIFEKEPAVAYSVRAAGDYRLPNNTEPIHYDIDLTTNVHNGSRDFTGTVHILLRVVEDTRTIVVHALQLQDFRATIQSADQANAPTYELSASYEVERHFLSLTAVGTAVNFNSGTNWTLTIAYKGQLRSDTSGFHRLSYTDESNKIHYMATTQFESTYARHGFPCYDEPAKRATFTITIRHDPSYSALSNMPMNETASSAGVTVFDKTNVTVSTYLIAFHVSDYAFTEGALHSLPHRLYSKPSSVGNHEFGLVSGMLILQHLADYYNVPFALPRMIQVAIPGKGGAMENWGLVTYGEQYLLFNRSTSTTDSQITIAYIIAHEFTHQWFGNHVAVRWWTYCWLKEGFATLFSYQGVVDVYPEWDYFQVFHTDHYQSALVNDGRGAVEPMTHYVQTPAEISGHYGVASYAKPGSVLFMWQHALGVKVFRSALNKYLTDNAFSSAEEWQLFAALQSAVDEHKLSIPARIAVMFPTWSQQVGYPLLTVKRDYASNTFTVTQTAYHDNTTINTGRTYYVPFNYAARSKPDYRDTTASHYLLNTREINITDKGVGANDWLILNKQSTGYYRINYDEQNWHLIAEGLVKTPYKVHTRNRAQLLYDAYRFATFDRLPQNVLLKLLTYLPGEDQYAPWSAANSIISTYNSYLNGHADYNEFRQFIASLVSNIYEQLGVNEPSGEQLLRKYTRNIAINLACLVGVEDCLTETNNKLKALISNGVAIEPNLKSQAYCNGLRQSNNTEYNYFFDDFLRSSDTSYRNTLLRALGCSQNKEQLESFVKSTINLGNSLSSSERTTILSAAYSRGPVGLLVCIEFLSGNWEAYSNLSNRTGAANPLNSDIVSMSQYVNNENQQQELLALVDKVKSSDKVQANLEATVRANAKVNFDWLEKNSEQVMSFVKSFHRTSSSTALSASLLTAIMAIILTLSRCF